MAKMVPRLHSPMLRARRTNADPTSSRRYRDWASKGPLALCIGVSVGGSGIISTAKANRPERSCRQSTTTRDPFLVLGELPGHLPAAALP